MLRLPQRTCSELAEHTRRKFGSPSLLLSQLNRKVHMRLKLFHCMYTRGCVNATCTCTPITYIHTYVHAYVHTHTHAQTHCTALHVENHCPCRCACKASALYRTGMHYLVLYCILGQVRLLYFAMLYYSTMQ